MYGFTHYLYHTGAPSVVRPFNKRYKPSISETLHHCVGVCVCVCINYICRHVEVYEHTVSVYLCTLILFPTHGSDKSRCFIISGAPDPPPPYSEISPENQNFNVCHHRCACN